MQRKLVQSYTTTKNVSVSNSTHGWSATAMACVCVFVCSVRRCVRVCACTCVYRLSPAVLKILQFYEFTWPMKCQGHGQYQGRIWNPQAISDRFKSDSWSNSITACFRIKLTAKVKYQGHIPEIFKQLTWLLFCVQPSTLRHRHWEFISYRILVDWAHVW